VRRRMELKIIKAGMDTKEVVARFEHERQGLALMNYRTSHARWMWTCAATRCAEMIREREPKKPSTLMKTLAAATAGTVASCRQASRQSSSACCAVTSTGSS